MSGHANHDCEPNGDDLNLTAFALNQLDETERAEVERQLAEANGDASKTVEQTRRLAEKVREVLAADNRAASPSLRETLDRRMSNADDADKPQPADKPQSFWRRHVVELAVASLVMVLMVSLLLPAVQLSREAAWRMQSTNNMRQLDGRSTWHEEQNGVANADGDRWQRGSGSGAPAVAAAIDDSQSANALRNEEEARSMMKGSMKMMAESPRHQVKGGSSAAEGDGVQPMGTQPGPNLHAGGGTSNGDQSGGENQGGQSGSAFVPLTGRPQGGQQNSTDHWAMLPRTKANSFDASAPASHGAMGMDYDTLQKLMQNRGQGNGQGQGQRSPGGQAVDPGKFGGATRGDAPIMIGEILPEITGAEQYAPIVENAFIPVQGIDALSTFSIDVDTASYANVRRFLSQGQLPPPNAVRIEELVNYFGYDYPQPKAGEPFSANMEVAECPWQQKHLLLRVGLKGREIHHKERPVSNLVFLLDVSGSMADQNKLPLLKQVLSMMVRELREDDRVSIVTYAGEAGIRLPPTTGDQQERILQAIDSLQSGGSTNGSAGIDLAYEQAQAYFRKEGTNRVILATDGDLNVGITDDESLVRMIKEKAAGGVFLTVLGFGEGNLKDAKMERLADNGNGLFAYIDSVREGRKVLIEQMSGSLVTIAKDVKIQIEFNPAQVQAYRLIGYENRMLTAPEFSDDRRDAGEIGAGHTVTALYELAPAGAQPAGSQPEEATLRYQAGVRGQESGVRSQESRLTDAATSGEILTLKLRYKEPEGMASKLSEYPLKNRGGKFNAASKDFQFAAAVASFGMQLRNSQFRGEGNLAAVAEIAAASIGEDKGGYRAEFVDLVRKAQSLGVK
ncbi:MAG TPA: von Willebrand factor type A domain-containing protein [Pirellulaceae bacterium]|nr:von Willebrand factor type A domain-containing protein [Pirellulaceae bacterium]